MNGIETTVELFFMRTILPKNLTFLTCQFVVKKNISQELQIFCESKKWEF